MMVFRVFELFIVAVLLYLVINLCRYFTAKTLKMGTDPNCGWLFGLSGKWMEEDEKKTTATKKGGK